MLRYTVSSVMLLLLAGTVSAGAPDDRPTAGDAHMGIVDTAAAVAEASPVLEQGTGEQIFADGFESGDTSHWLPWTFPEFYTSTSKYFTLQIGPTPSIDPGTYRLSITGMVDTPRELTLSELQALPQTTRPLTVECIGNAANGKLVGTAVWSGFSLYDLLVSSGLQAGAVAVRYTSADGYWASHTMEQVQNGGVIGALSINGAPLPPINGFPVRFLLPGYHGLKHPAWVTQIEVLGEPVDDYYDVHGWQSNLPIPADSKFFSPAPGATVTAGQPFHVGGAAYGGTRISRVEVTANGGQSWVDANIVRREDLDHVWVFWRAMLTISEPGIVELRARATDINGHVQPETDTYRFDGTEAWPSLSLNVVAASP